MFSTRFSGSPGQMCGVQKLCVYPASTSIFAHSSDSATVRQPSSTPGSRCECTSIRPVFVVAKGLACVTATDLRA
jgi:hypothetical protein